MTGSLPNTLNGWEQLEELDITNNKFSGSIPNELGELTYLKSVNLSFNYFTGGIPLQLFQIEGVELLYFHVNKLSDTISDDICVENKAIKILIYGNSFCPPYPECIKYIGKQTCEN